MVASYLFSLWGKIFYAVYPNKVVSFIKWFNKRLYSSFVVNRFRQHGDNCLISKSARIIGGKQIIIGNSVRIDNGAIVSTWSKYGDDNYSPQLIIGDGVHISDYCHISCVNAITIDNNVLLGKKVLINDNSHGIPDNYTHLCIPPEKRPLSSKGEIHISENVWIGEGACILAGVSIGKGSIIGANAVVTKDIPAYSIAVGIPAKVIKVVKENDIINI